MSQPCWCSFDSALPLAGKSDMKTNAGNVHCWLQRSKWENGGITCYVMPYHVVTCYAISCHAMLCYVMLRYAMSCYAVSCDVISCYIMPCHFSIIDINHRLPISINQLLLTEKFLPVDMSDMATGAGNVQWSEWDKGSYQAIQFYVMQKPN